MGFQHTNTQTRTHLHPRTRIMAHTQQTRMCNDHTRIVRSGPHKVDVRLLLYRGCHKELLQQWSTRINAVINIVGAKQLACGVSIALLGSSPAEKRPRGLLARFRDFERPEHAPRSPPGTQTSAVVYRRVPCVPRSRERRKDPRAPEKSVLM